MTMAIVLASDRNNSDSLGLRLILFSLQLLLLFLPQGRVILGARACVCVLNDYWKLALAVCGIPLLAFPQFYLLNVPLGYQSINLGRGKV